MLKGQSGSPGVAAGTVVRWRPRSGAPARSRLTTAEERAALTDASNAVARELEAAARGAESREERSILAAQASMAADPALLERASVLLESEDLDAAAAAVQAAELLAEDLGASGWERSRQRSTDLREVATMIAARLGGVAPQREPLPEDAVIVAADLGPAETAALDRSRVRGFVLERSSPTAHTAILARTYAIPAVVQVGDSSAVLHDGAPVVVDGDAGTVHPDPDAQLLAEVDERRERDARRREREREVAGPAVLADGVTVHLAANVGSAEQARAAGDQGARRIGLFRTEFLFMERSELPTEAEQEAQYREAIEAMGGGRVILRTLDAGGDKPIPAIDRAEEVNPMLGRRGIRLGLAHPELLRPQLRAMLRAATSGPVGIMFPMVATVDEVQTACVQLEEVRAELVADGDRVGRDIRVGIMVETPAAVLAADVLAGVVDFFSIGTNDLLQYTFAADRDNSAVAALLDPLHPALLRAVRLVVEGAASHGVEVAVCGEAAADPQVQLLLVGLGVDELSMVATCIAETRENLARWTRPQLRELAEQALEERSAAGVRALLERSREEPAGDGEGALDVELTLGHPEGLHARPANEVARIVAEHDSKVVIRKGEREGDAASVLALLSLGADTGDQVVVSAEGPDAKQVVDAIGRYLTRG